MERETYCGIEEHKHTDSCYSVTKRCICGQDEIEGHEHTDQCYSEEKVLDCDNEEEDHVHSEECYVIEKVLTCQKQVVEGHKHDDSCFEEVTELTCGKEEHIHNSACFIDPDAETEPVKRNDTADEEDSGEDLEETEEYYASHGNDDGADPENNDLSETTADRTTEEPAMTSAEDAAEENPTEKTTETETETAETETDETETDETETMSEPDPELVYPEMVLKEKIKEGLLKTWIEIEVYAPEGALPEGSSLLLEQYETGKGYQETFEDTLDNTLEGGLLEYKAVKISFLDAAGKPVVPLREVQVYIKDSIVKDAEKLELVQIDDEKKNDLKTILLTLDEEENAYTDEDVVTYQNWPSDPAVLAVASTTLEKTLTAEGPDYSISVDCGAKACVPAGASLKVKEIQQSSRAYNGYVSDAEKTLEVEEGNISYARFFDITIVDQKGKEIQPKEAVDVKITLDDLQENIEEEAETAPQVVHFGDDDEPEIVGSEQDGDEVSFAAEGFSVYGLFVTLQNRDRVLNRAADDQVANLAEFVTDATINIDGTIYGQGDVWSVREGVDYALTLTFKESGARQFPEGGAEMVMEPAYIGGVQLVPGQSGTFDIPMGLYGTVEGNTWWVDDEGMLHIKFGEDQDGLLTRSNKTHIDIEFNVKFSGDGNIIKFNDRVERPWKANTETDVSVNKSGYYDAATGKMNYTITVTSTGTSKNVKVTDTFASQNLLTLDVNSITISPQKELDDDQSVTGAGGFTRVIKEMTNNETVTITYTASVNESALDPGGKVVGDEGKNTVRVEDDDHHDEKIHIVNEIRFADLNKVSTSSEDNGDGTVTLNWKITANTDRIAPLVGSKITDKISLDSKDIMHYAVDAEGRVKLHVVGTNVNGTEYVKDIYVTPENNDGQQGSPTWTWIVENIGEHDGTPLSYEITYQTVADKQQTASVSVKNEAENESGGSETGTGIIPGPEPIVARKEAVQVEEDYVDWTIVVNIPENGFDQLEVIDTLPARNLLSSWHKDTIEEPIGDNVSVYDPSGQANYTLAYNEGADANKLTITFYKNNPAAADPQPGIGGPARTITISIRTKNDREWVDLTTSNPEDYAYAVTHINTATVNGQEITAEASPVKKTIQKNHLKALDTKYNDLPCFAYEVILGGVKKAEDYSFTDTFNSEYLALVPGDYEIRVISRPDLWGEATGIFADCEQINGGTVRFSAQSIPLQANGSPYAYYKVVYYLYVKSPEVLKHLQSQAIANRGKYTLKNTALWGDLPSECEVDYEFGPVTKDGYFASSRPDERKYIFVIDVNPDRYKLSRDGSGTIEMTDEHTSNLTVNYSSVKIYQIPDDADIGKARTAYESGDLDSYELPRGSIPWNFSGNDGVFYLNDETHYVVVYDAVVIGSGEQPFSNVADLEGFIAPHNNTRTYSGEAQAGGEIWEINLLKYKNGMTSNGLEGAVFQLFRGTGEYIQESDDQGHTWWVEQKEPMKYGDTAWTREQGLVGENITFTTGPEGTVTIMLEQPVHGNEIEGNVHYFLKEIDSPPGYQIDSSVEYWAFSLTMDSGEVNYGDPKRVDEYGNRQWIYFYYNDILKMANTETTEPLDVEVNKSWFDENGDPITEENLDDSVKAVIQLMRKTDSGEYVQVKVEYDEDGNPTVTEVDDGSGEVELNSGNQWSWRWEDLPRVKMGGDKGLEIVERYAYKVEEVELEGYIVAVEETETETVKTYALHNYKKPDDKNTEVTVEKNWQDSDGNTIDGTEENLPPDIGFYLYQVVSTTPFTTPPRSGGAKYIIPEDTRLVDPGETDPESPDYGLYRVSKTDGWTTTFENLPEIRNVDGTTFYYGYYVRELPMEGYTITYTYNGTTRTIVNKEPLPPDNEYIDIGLEKKWVSGDNTAPPAGASATFTVHQQKSERSEAQGTIPVRIVDDNDTEVFSIMASEDDVLDNMK